MATTARAEAAYLNITGMVNKEQKKGIRLLELMRARIDLKNEEDVIKARREAADKELKGMIDTYEVRGIIYPPENLIAELVNNRSGGKWDKAKAVQKVAPDVLEEIYSEGTPFTYLKVEVSEKKVLEAL